MKIKQTLFGMIFAVLMFSASAFALDMVVWPVDELEMDVSLPADYNYVFTREMSEDDPILADWGMTKNEIFANDSLYLAALTESQNSEIILSMMETDWSQMYYDFNDLGEEDLEELAQYCLMNHNTEVVMEYEDYGLFYGNDQAKFLQAVGSFEKDGAEGHTVQYVTVLSGNAYTVTFNFYAGEPNDAQMAMSEDVVTALAFHDITKDSKEVDMIFYIITVLILVVIIISLLIWIRKKDYSIAEPVDDSEDPFFKEHHHEEAGEEQVEDKE